MSGTAPDASDTVADLGEHGVIARIRERLGPLPAWVHVGAGVDDAAVIEPARNTLEVLTTDALVEGIHFAPSLGTYADAGYKALAINVSDLAAMGAAPRAALLSLALPPALPSAQLDALLDGFLEAAKAFDVALVGGNITRSPGPLGIDVTLTGWVKPRKVITRSGARPGDELFVTGTLGTAAAGLDWLRQKTSSDGSLQPCVDRWRRPEPRLRIGIMLGRSRTASACIDLSDGAADGARQLATASGVGIFVEASALPIDPAARAFFTLRGRDPVEAALTGGEDYELLFTVPRKRRRSLDAVSRQGRGLPLTRIGAVTEEPGVRLRRGDRDEPMPAGFVHF